MKANKQHSAEQIITNPSVGEKTDIARAKRSRKQRIVGAAMAGILTAGAGVAAVNNASEKTQPETVIIEDYAPDQPTEEAQKDTIEQAQSFMDDVAARINSGETVENISYKSGMFFEVAEAEQSEHGITTVYHPLAIDESHIGYFSYDRDTEQFLGHALSLEDGHLQHTNETQGDLEVDIVGFKTDLKGGPDGGLRRVQTTPEFGDVFVGQYAGVSEEDPQLTGTNIVV